MKSERINCEQTDGSAKAHEHALPGEAGDLNSNLRLIRIFNHYRHDWMNDIQLLFGYVKLKKYDKLEDLMEKIKGRVLQESCLSKLGHADLIVYLLSFQAEVKDMLLEIEMEREIHINELPLDGDGMFGLLKAAIEAFKSNSLHHGDGEHRLTVELADKNGRLEIHMRYQGTIKRELLSEELERAVSASALKVRWDKRLLDEHRAEVHIEIPYST
ncbi:Spo0B domain-containing protein [Paenibacillus piri]|uniref:SpoOB alpha-helical domain-containing protein n=1 Tax=Paenibacillus piri TaxID=2547395 RepID=A0A4R5KRM5_9BACL|nr:Spo0B domain-containing protein [Paenibacillus piri]TDF97648.1 hypothetical protein E1757_13685 [Paenibacillus piri]